MSAKYGAVLASAGIGRAIAEGLLRSKAKVIAVTRTQSDLHSQKKYVEYPLNFLVGFVLYIVTLGLTLGVGQVIVIYINYY